MARPILLLCAGFAALALPARAAGLSEPDAADLKRAFAAASLSTSEEPAVRAERTLKEPSAGFMIGAALGAWSGAREQLDFDLQNPAAAGPPHASQGAPVDEAMEQDCREETTAFARLETRSRSKGVEPAEVLLAAALSDAALLDAWRARSRQGPAPICR